MVVKLMTLFCSAECAPGNGKDALWREVSGGSAAGQHTSVARVIGNARPGSTLAPTITHSVTLTLIPRTPISF